MISIIKSFEELEPFILENLFLNRLAKEIYSDIFQYYKIVIPWVTEIDGISTNRNRLSFQAIHIDKYENLIIEAQQFRKIKSIKKKKKEKDNSGEEDKNETTSVAKLPASTLFYQLENTYGVDRFDNYKFHCFRKGNMKIDECQEMYVKGAFHTGHNIKPLPFADFLYSKDGSRLRSESYCNNSRNHLYFKILEKMNQYGEGIVTFSFVEYFELEHANTEIIFKNVDNYKKDTLNIVEKYYSGKKIRITTKEKELLPKCKKVKEMISYYNCSQNGDAPIIPWIDSEVVFNKLDRDGLNLVITHPENFYKSNEMQDNDAYKLTVGEGLIVQHLTDDVFTSEAKLKAALNKSIFALAIKSDILNKKMCLFNSDFVKVLKKDATIVDFLTVEREKIKEDTNVKYSSVYYHMQVDLETMNLDFHKYKSEDEIPLNIMNLIINAKMDNFYDNFIIEDKKRLFAIKRTETIALIDEIPMLEHIQKVENKTLADGVSQSLRAKDNKHLIENALNMHCYLCQNETILNIQICSGIILNGGMNKKIPKAVHMYKVYCYDSIGLDEEHLKDVVKYLDLMKLNCITSSERFTVLPFPFHYVREYKNYLNALKKMPKEDSDKGELK